MCRAGSPRRIIHRHGLACSSSGSITLFVVFLPPARLAAPYHAADATAIHAAKLHSVVGWLQRAGSTETSRGQLEVSGSCGCRICRLICESRASHGWIVEAPVRASRVGRAPIACIRPPTSFRARFCPARGAGKLPRGAASAGVAVFRCCTRDVGVALRAMDGGSDDGRRRVARIYTPACFASARPAVRVQSI